MIAIEMKIDASQSLDQLFTYRNVIETHEAYHDWRRRYVFLTKQMEEPEDEPWIPINLSVLEAVGKRVKGKGEHFAARMFEAYLAMLRRHHMGDKKLEELAQGLWSKHREALLFLVDQAPDSLGEVMSAITGAREQIARDASTSLNIVYDSSTASIVRFAVERRDELPNFKSGIPGWSSRQRLILSEIKRERNERVAATLYLGPAQDTSTRETYSNLLADARLRKTRIKMTPTYSCLAKETLFDAQEIDEIDLDEARETIVKGFIDFVRKVVPHFDAALHKLVVTK